MSTYTVLPFRCRDPDATTTWVLTLDQPWLHRVLHQRMRVVGLQWCPPLRIVGEQIYLYASDEIDHDGYWQLLEQRSKLPDKFEVGAILGSCVVDNIVLEPDSPSLACPYGLTLSAVKIVEEPIVMPGGSRLWEAIPWWE